MSSQRVAFFGATGDCAGFCLAHTLNAGYNCIALARTPAKLTSSMKAKGVSDETLDQHLTIVSGNVKDVEAVKRALVLNGQVVDRIVSGIGGTPKLQWSLWKPVTLTDTTICQDAGGAILKALTELKPAKKPVFINVSTTGINPPGSPPDVPFWIRLLYHWVLQAPHEDKRVLEKKLADVMKQSNAPLSFYVNVKPTLLTGGEPRGVDVIRNGTEDAPAVGYTIAKSDVGLFMAEKLIKQDVADKWRNKSVTLTN